MQAQHGAAGQPDGLWDPVVVRDARSERRLTWLLFARLGEPFCFQCGEFIGKSAPHIS